MNRYGIGLILLGSVLGACSNAPTEPPKPVELPSVPPQVIFPLPDPQSESTPPSVLVVVEQSGAVRALEYFMRVRQRSVRELRLEHDSLRKSFAGSRSDHDRVRLALLLSLPNAPFTDEAQALELLEPLTRDGVNEYQPLAQLLTMLLNEQRRRGNQANALQQKLDRIMALEKELQQRAATPESKPR